MKRSTSLDQEALSRSMKIVVKGSMLVLFGLACSRVFDLVRRILIVRSLSQSDYGIYAIGTAVMLVAAAFVYVGLDIGISRFIAFYRGRGDISRARGTIYSAARIGTVSTSVTVLLLVGLAWPISHFFGKPSLPWVLVIVAASLPINVVIAFTVSYYQGFEKPQAKAWFSEIGLSAFTTIGVVIAIAISPHVTSVMIGFLLGFAATLVALAVYAWKKPPARFPDAERVLETRRLLAFSLPLMATVLGIAVVYNADTVFLGYFVSAGRVGVYNAAVPVYRMLALFLMAFEFIYAPVAARLVGEKRLGELGALYPSVTKWLFVFTLPAWFICFFFPHQVLTLLFGARYAGAAHVLQILVAAEFIHTLLGPNSATLAALGRAKLLMANAAVATVLDLTLLALLVPRYGLVGAALGTGITLVVWNLITSAEVFALHGIQPFHRDYVVPVAVTLVLAVALYWPLKALLGLTIWILPLYYLILLPLVFAVIVATRSLDESDMAIWRAVKGRASEWSARRRPGGGSDDN